jgi:hypothetical protein
MNNLRSSYSWALKNLPEKAVAALRVPQVPDIMNTWDRHPGGMFVVQGSIQSWKTLVAQALILASVRLRPAPTAFYSKSGEAIDEFINEKFGPLFDATPEVKNLILPDHDTKRFKRYPHMHLFLFSAGVQLARNSKSLVNEFIDEPWTLEPGYLEEIIGRTTAEEDVARVMLTTSGPDKGSETDGWWERSDQRVWHGVCRDCGSRVDFDDMRPDPVPLKKRHTVPGGDVVQAEDEELFQPWGGLLFDLGPDVRGKDDVLDLQKFRASVRYQCPACGSAFKYNPGLLQEMNDPERGADYVPQNEKPDRLVFGWNWNALCHTNWERRAVQYIQAVQAKRRGDLSRLEEWWRKRRAKAWNIKNILKEDNAKGNYGGYKLGDPWEAGRHRFMTIDVQQDHYWVGIRDWDGSAWSRPKHVEKVLSAGDLRQMQLDWKVPDFGGMEQVRRQSKTNQVVLLKPCHVGIDGNHYTAQVRRLAALNSWLVLRGRDQDDFLHADGMRRIYDQFRIVDAWEGTLHAGQDHFVLEMHFSNKRAMEILWHLRNPDDGQSRWTYADDMPEWYYKGVDAWGMIVKRRKKDNSFYREFQQLDDFDHPYDFEKMNVVMAATRGIVGPAVEAGTENKDDAE